jgi:hypothetical protein
MAAKYITLAKAHLCVDCQIVSSSSTRCPKCGGRGLFSVERLFNGAVGATVDRMEGQVEDVCRANPRELAQQALQRHASHGRIGGSLAR